MIAQSRPPIEAVAHEVGLEDRNGVAGEELKNALGPNLNGPY